MWEYQFPNEGSEQSPRHWKWRVLTTGPLGKSPYFFFFFASLGLCCCAWASLQWPTTGSRVHGLSGCGTWAWLWPCSTWDPWPGIEPASPALEGGFLTTKSPGEISSSVQSLFATLWTAACQASLSITNSQSLLKLTSITSVMSSNHLILCRPLLCLPSIFPSIRVFSNWVSSSHQVAKILELQLQHQSFQ